MASRVPMRGPCDGDLRTWSGLNRSSHKQSSLCAVGLSSASGAGVAARWTKPPRLPDPMAESAAYQVVARRYRPQRFADLVGQEHVAKGLSGAIESGRIGHAYLFTGARGVGKTSAARIYAKALECERGPAAEPCNECDSCRAISAGQDVDVVEIDAASNRGIDEIRQLRQNVAVRPARGRFKIYIIDEVHMLTREAFNALLKTLEEPPPHVKFVLCTTEPEKLPITILSRCQRFDFTTVATPSIAGRLAQIVEAEGADVSPEALTLIARRAAGSMRDSQSLLEQLLGSASARAGSRAAIAVTSSPIRSSRPCASACWRASAATPGCSRSRRASVSISPRSARRSARPRCWRCSRFSISRSPACGRAVTPRCSPRWR